MLIQMAIAGNSRSTVLFRPFRMQFAAGFGARFSSSGPREQAGHSAVIRKRPRLIHARTPMLGRDVQGPIRLAIRRPGPDPAADPSVAGGGFEALIGEDVVGRLVRSRSHRRHAQTRSASVPERLRGLDGVWFGHDRLSVRFRACGMVHRMLAQAALHTLDINEELIQHGFILKDATPCQCSVRRISPRCSSMCRRSSR